MAVSGLHKAPAFRAVGPRDGRPVMLDDTCYFLPCSSAPEAAALSALCNDPIALTFLGAASFADAKRPITKALLQRLDLRAILERADRRGLRDRAALAMAEDLAIAMAADWLDRSEEIFLAIGRDPEAGESDRVDPARLVLLA